MIKNQTNDTQSLQIAINKSWNKVAPFWPLKNIVAVNPLVGFEDLSFEAALKQSQAYFQQKDMPDGMQHVNRESIKWLQAFFDEGQSTMRMPNLHLGFLNSALSLIKFDKKIHNGDPKKLKWLHKLPLKPEAIIEQSLLNLDIPQPDYENFLTLMLTTLPGWASHIQYRTSWANNKDKDSFYTITQSEYLAFRLVLTCLMWPAAKTLIAWHQAALNKSEVKAVCHKINANEAAYQDSLLKQIKDIKNIGKLPKAKAQLVFCIDARSEPFRRAIESQDDYETYGFAGSFGLPVTIENSITGESHASCSVLLKPTQKIIEHPTPASHYYQKSYIRLQGIKKIYQSVKYNFTTPFSLVGTIGIFNGLWMGVRSFFPNIATKIQEGIKQKIAPSYNAMPDIKSIPLEKQVSYGSNALKIMGLTDSFAPLIVFCGHGSTTQNNAYATALHCGACGGNHGAPNARIIAAILNSEKVRKKLDKQGIKIPEDTLFIAAGHNTTTDEVDIYTNQLTPEQAKQIAALKQDLEKAKNKNSLWRAHEMGINPLQNKAYKATALRSQDWAQVRPEWGLARNASFIVGPRALTKNINLQSRSFLQSYDWEKDQDGSSLTAILTSTMIVPQWINAQYLFSTLDNVAFGGGSKITKNITGKIGIMQGNASDLMYGLPLQSVYKSDQEAYHQLIRLTVIVYAPKIRIDQIIANNSILQKLFGNEWIHLICYDPKQQQKLRLQKNLRWSNISNI